MLGSGFGPLEAKYLAPLLGFASPYPVVFLSQGIVLRLGLAHGVLESYETVFSVHACLLPALPVFLGNGGDLEQVLVHLV